MALIKLCFAFLIFCLACGAVGSFFIFLFDVVKWHLQEKRTVISASAQKLPKMFDERSDLNGRSDNTDTGNNGTSGDSYGDSNGNSGSGSISDSGTDSRERDASTIFDSWLQP